MTFRPLPAGLSTLVHHVELTKSGWRESTLELLVKSLLCAGTDGKSHESLSQSVTSSLGEGVGSAKIASICERLISRGDVVRLPNNTLKVSESAHGQIRACTEEAHALESRVAKHFDSLASRVEHCSISWEDFREKFVLPLVDQLGARTYEIISGKGRLADSQLAALAFLEGCEEEAQPSVKTLIRDFLGADDEDVRAYILGALHAFFLIQATGLSEAAIEHIHKSAGQTRSLTILCDTNFLFSLLGLHENPSDDSADALHPEKWSRKSEQRDKWKLLV